MAERTNPLTQTSPINGTGIAITYAGPLQLTQIRAKSHASLPTEPLTSTSHGETTILWLGPDEWLLTGEPTNIQNELGDALRASVDVSHRTLAIDISGPQATSVLNASCPLDLHITKMPAGSTARSHLGKTAITLHRADTNSFRLFTNRSFADYTWRLLATSAQEFV